MLHQLADGIGALIRHQAEPKPAISLSSHTGGVPHLAASHVLLQLLFAFLHFLFFLSVSLHRMKLASHSLLQVVSSES